MISFYFSGFKLDFTYILRIVWTSKSFEKITHGPRWEGLICFFICFVVSFTHGNHKSLLISSGKCLEFHRTNCHHLFLGFCEAWIFYISYFHRTYCPFLSWQTYQHASAIIQSLVEEDINVKFLVQLDKLVRLLETPIFAYLRLQVFI